MKLFLSVALVFTFTVLANAEDHSRHMKVTATNMAEAGRLGILYAATFEDKSAIMPLACTTKLQDGSDNPICQMPIVGEHYEVHYQGRGRYMVTGPDSFFAEMVLGVFFRESK